VANGLGLNTRRLKKGRGPILYTVTGDISSSHNELEDLVDDLPGCSLKSIIFKNNPGNTIVERFFWGRLD
jgi:hypothetical protein